MCLYFHDSKIRSIRKQDPHLSGNSRTCLRALPNTMLHSSWVYLGNRHLNTAAKAWFKLGVYIILSSRSSLTERWPNRKISSSLSWTIRFAVRWRTVSCSTSSFWSRVRDTAVRNVLRFKVSWAYKSHRKIFSATVRSFSSWLSIFLW